jgi:hypothetical protein
MKLENCPKCSQELIFLQSSGRHICRTCGAINQQQNEETEQLQDSEGTSSPETVVILEETAKELKIPSKANDTFYGIFGLVVLIFIFGGCVASMISPEAEPAYNSNSSPEPEYNSSSKDVENTTSDVEPKTNQSQVGLGQFSEEEICRAAIAAIMGRDPQIINVDKVDSGIVYTSYIRPDDDSRWANRCRVEKQTQGITWATDTGRWRTDPEDGKLSYSINENVVKIAEEYSDGSLSKNEYSLEQLNMTSPEPEYNSNSSSEAEYNSSSKIDPNDPEYIDSVIDRSGVGQTIDSVQEMVDTCMVMLQDQGMTYSQAYDRCN